MPVCEYCQQDIIIIALTSEDISIELTSDVKTLCVAVIIVSNHVLQCLEGCVTTAVC